MVVASASLLVIAAAAGFAQCMHAAQGRSGKSAHTFIVDPPTMFLVGLLGTVIGLCTRRGRKLTLEQFRARRSWVDRGLSAFFILFWVSELLMYFDVLKHPYDAAKSGNDFMWNGYLDLLGWQPFHWQQATYHYWWTYPLLLVTGVVQWYSLRAGRALGYLSGRNALRPTDDA